MAKSFRLRISRAFPSFHFCRPKSDDVMAITTPILYRLAPISLQQHPVGCRTAQRRSLRRDSSAAGTDADAEADDLPLARGTPAYLWRKEEKWHVITCGGGGGDSPPRRRKIDSNAAARRRMRRRSARRPRARASTSSDSGWFSSDDEEGEEEKEGGGDGFYEELSTGSSDNVRMGRSGIGATEDEEEDKVGGSFAVVKRSEDPRGDFRRSMAEMVVEKEIYDSAGLERLLQCFLSLNARHHHKAIVDAFGDIWDAIFPTSATPPALLPKYLL
ncbi:uncharacterized protein [Typha angustifolia]|uniref:uncharacterized protein n=1 Tax=Typha angustifolia TaxID=59011 RepID=UPI003C2E47B8